MINCFGFFSLDPRIKDMWFMGSIWPLTFIVIVYLYFVLKLGPEIMRHRNPFNIDRIVMVYNAVQVLFSMYLMKEVIIILSISCKIHYDLFMFYF